MMWSQPAAETVRVVAYSPTASGLAPGSGPVAEFGWGVDPGAVGGEQCVLHPHGVLLADEFGESIEPVTGSDGVFTVTGVHHFAFELNDPVWYPPGGSPQCPLGFPMCVYAMDAEGNLLASYHGNVSLTSDCGNVDPAEVTFANGVWCGSVGVSTASDDPGYWCQITATDQATNISSTSDPFAVGSKGDLDVAGGVEIFDVIRAVNLMLGTPVTPPSTQYQSWGADTDCTNGHPCGNDAVQIFDLVRMIRYMLDGVWPCGGGAGGPAAVGGAAHVRLGLSSQRVGDELVVAVRADRAQGLAGLDVTVSWQAGNLRFSGAAPGGLLSEGWLVRAKQAGKSVRVVGVDPGGGGVSGAGDLLVLRFEMKGNTGKALRSLAITAAALSDAFGEAVRH